MLGHDLRLPRGGFFHREVVSRWKSENPDALRCRHAPRMLRELGIIAWQSAGRKPEVRSFKRHRASARLASPPTRHFHRTPWDSPRVDRIRCSSHHRPWHHAAYASGARFGRAPYKLVSRDTEDGHGPFTHSWSTAPTRHRWAHACHRTRVARLRN